MFRNQSTNNRVTRLHERITYIFSTINFLSIHDQNIQRLFTDIHKALLNIPANIYGDLFVRKNHDLNLRCRPELKIPSFSSQVKGKIRLHHHASVLSALYRSSEN